MILAIAAFVLQFPAIPQSSVPASAFLALDASATLQPGGQPAPAPKAAVNASPKPSAAAPAVAEPADSGPQPSDAVAFQPGRLVAEPVAGAPPAAGRAAGFPFSRGAAAFITSTPSRQRDRREEQRERHIWLALSIAQSSAAGFDAWSTRRVISNGGQELNPILRPFSGNASIYAAIQVAPLLLDYAGHRMMTSEHGWARHTWWMPQAIGTALSIASGVVNLSH